MPDSQPESMPRNNDGKLWRVKPLQKFWALIGKYHRLLFAFGSLMIIISTFGIVIGLPYIDNKISDVDTKIEIKTEFSDAIKYNLERASDTSAVMQNQAGVVIILKELKANQSTIDDMESILKQLILQNIALKYCLMNSITIFTICNRHSNPIEEGLLNKTVDELDKIDKDYTPKIESMRNAILGERKPLLDRKNNLLSYRTIAQLSLGFLNTLGLIFIFIADLSTKFN